MNFFIELERTQHLTVAVTTDFVDEAIHMAKDAYLKGMLPDHEWEDYKDDKSVRAKDVTVYCHPLKDLTGYASAVEFASRADNML